jgi:hypothetical protein
MMQKQKLKACLLAIVGIACMSFSQNQLALQGTYTAPNGTEVYLINLDNRDTLDVTKAWPPRRTNLYHYQANLIR